MKSVTLPWPDKELSPNARLHWAVKARKVAVARSSAYWEAKAQLPTPFKQAPDSVCIQFTPPDNRKRDRLNMIASFKALQDGIADAIGIDDSKWNEEYKFCAPEKPGKVEVVFE